jgi:UDP-N-acetyl-D-glucosamine dehydrogenase
VSESVVIIGLGYVGLPLAQAALEAGLAVCGLDVADTVVKSLNQGSSHVDDVCDEDLERMLALGFRATTDETVIGGADVVVICVPTPLTEDGIPDLDAVRQAGDAVARHVRHGALVVLESTVAPGTTEAVFLPTLGRMGEVGIDIFLAFSPERVDPGNSTYGVRNTPKVVGGVTAACTERATKFYASFVERVVPAKGTREAETSKLLENTFRHINIALVNEMTRVCHELDIDIWNVIACASTKPFGFTAFYPGPGVGGHCIPIDPNYFSHAVQSRLGYPFRFVELAQEINNSMPRYVFGRIQDLLNQKQKAVSGSRVLVVGITYKANIADLRESPAVELCKELRSAGAEVGYLDPLVDAWVVADEAVVKADIDDVGRYDCVVVLQHHDVTDHDAVVDRAAMVLDARGQLSGKDVRAL